MRGYRTAEKPDAVTFARFFRTVIAVPLTSRLDAVTSTHCPFTLDVKLCTRQQNLVLLSLVFIETVAFTTTRVKTLSYSRSSRVVWAQVVDT